MNIAFIASTENGLALAQRLANNLEQQGENASVACGFGQHEVDCAEWAREHFTTAMLVFIGTTSIAIHAIAPLLQDKQYNPAVVVIDERGTNCIPLLSGSLGNTNALAKTLSNFCGANLVLTTDSDINTAFAVDSWAATQGLLIPETTGIELITSALLKNEPVECATAFPISDAIPQGINIIPISKAFEDNHHPRFHVGCRVDAVADLDIIVPVAILGIGCRKGTTAERIEESCALFLEQAGIHPASLCCVASISLKASEPGLLEFAQQRNLPLVTFEATEQNNQEGDFSASDFVASISDTSCTCDPTIAAAGDHLLTNKTVINGITFAIALKDPHLSWNYSAPFEQSA